MGSQAATDFLVGAFPIVVGAIASEDAESLCQKNDLSFVELLRPFCQLDSDAQIHDPVNPNIVIQVKKLQIRVVDIQSPLPPPVLATSVLSEVVSKTCSLPDLNSVMSLDEQIKSSTKWYEAYRDCFFQLMPPMNHEFIRDILACILVVSTKHADPMHAFAALSSRQNSIQHSQNKPKNSFNYFSTNPLKYYLLLHDVSDGEDEKAEVVYQNMKSVYGSHTCFLLKINSRQKKFPNAEAEKMNFSDPWSPHIYPFSDDTFDFDEADYDKEMKQNVQVTQEADRKEEAIVNELENIDKQIEQNPDSPCSIMFSDPLTNMHYDDALQDDSDLGPLSLNEPPKNQAPKFRPRKISERTMKLQEYKRSLRQISFRTVVKSLNITLRKERGHCMTLVDQDMIKIFIYEFTVRSLLPYIEKLMRSLSEQILARRGIHKSIFHATKKWFGSNKASGGGIGGGFSAGSSYDNESAELQYRRLGDLSFLVQHYDLAYNSYHSAKREFNNDHAWMYFAGALEMAAISAFMQGSLRVYPAHYFEACITTYLDTCRMVDFATRACIMSTEALRSKEMYRESAVELIKLTNEDSDLRSALFLEQAAHCYIHNKPSMIRKYAFHMILAGHRYNKAAQRKHTLRCYLNALQVYSSKGWHLAEDHVNFTIGRQSFNLGNLNDSQLALKSLLLYQSEQPASQQASYLREFLAVFKQNLVSLRTKRPNDKSLLLPELPLPHIKVNLTRCLLYVKEQDKSHHPASPITPSQRRTRTIHAGVYTFQRNYNKNYVKKWGELEKTVATHVSGSAPYPFKPYCPCISSETNNQSSPYIAVNEAFAYEVDLSNPLKIPLNLLNLTLLWEFVPKDDPETIITNRESDQPDFVWTEKVANLLLNTTEEKQVPLKLSVKVGGSLRVLGLKYTLSSVAVTSSVDEYGKGELSLHEEAALGTVGVTGMQELNVKGPRMNTNKEERAGVVYRVDKRLEPLILPELPLLEVKMVDLPVTLLCGEVQKSVFHFKNIGHSSLKNIHIICSQPNYFSYGKQMNRNNDVINNSNNSNSNNSNLNSEIYNIQTSENGQFSLHINADKLTTSSNSDVIRIPLDNDELPPQCEIMIPVYVFGINPPGVHEINFVFYYEPIGVREVPYRLIQQMIRLQTLNSLSMSVTSRSMNGNFLLKDNIATADSSRRYANPELLISLSIENQAQAGANLQCVEFDLKHVSCYSCRWDVESLVDLSQETYKLRPGEKCSLHLKSTLIKETQGNIATESGIQLSDDKKSLHGEESLALFMKPGHNVESVLNSLGLVLYWETFFIDEGFTRVVISGQSHVTVGEESFEVSPSANQPSAVTSGINISYQYPAIVQHDFHKKSLCVVEVAVKCSNITDRTAIIEIEAVDLHEDSVGANTPVEKHSLNLIQWVGRRQISLEVSSQSTGSVVMQAMFSSVGVYEIQNLNAYVDNQPEGGGLLEKVSLKLPSSHLLCIEKPSTVVESG